MAIKYDKNIPKIYLYLIKHMGIVQYKILKVLLENDPKREGIYRWEIFNAVRNMSNCYHNSYVSITNMFKSRILAKVIKGEHEINNVNSNNISLKNKAWFFNTPICKMEATYIIHPKYNDEILKMIIESKEIKTLNNIKLILTNAYVF